tara:strand:- start:241 stop:384 length:144 start_codon:yes stop_codon:yes gene_type:complete
MKKFIEWHKRQTEWWMNKLNVGWYGVAWIAWIKGVVIGVLIYHLMCI